MKKSLVCLLLSTMLINIPSMVKADEQAVKEAQAKYNEYTQKISELEGVVMDIDNSIIECITEIEKNNQKIEELNTQIKTSGENISKLEKDIEDREDIKDNRLREMYKSGNVSANYLEMLISSENVYNFFERVSALSRVIKLDREMIESIEEDKYEIQQELIATENAKKDLIILNNDVKKQQEDLADKKGEQEQIIASIEEEKNKFGVEVLEVAERDLVQPQIDSIKNNSGDLSALNNAVSQLTAMRDNQIQTEAVKSEINSAIEEANGYISKLRVQLSGATISNPSRGSVNVTGQDIVNYAYQFLGTPYVWGATGPDTFDCSGFTSYVYRYCANLEITRTTYTQIDVGTPVAYEDMQAGDLVFMRNNEHVGIYIGNGQMIHAPRTGDVVKVSNVFSFYAARRIL